ncbi:MAG: hypothetical protein ACHQWU_12785 [Gemmatimonadales bacterium]
MISSCSACGALATTAAVARHNLECAETGERSYCGHAPHHSLEQTRLDRERALVARIESLAERGFLVASA